LGIPMAFAQLSQTLMNTTDVALVGRLKGESLAAMAVGQATYGMVLSLGIGVVAAVSPLVSQAHGAHNEKAISRALVIGCYASLLLTVLFWPLLYSVDHLFHWLEYEPEMITLATGYTRAAMLGLPFSFIFFVQKNYLDSVSRPRWPMLVAVVGILVNLLADYALMYGHFGFPEMGVMGTGLATTVVNLFMALSLLPACRQQLRTPLWLRQTKRSWKEFLEVGLPIAGTIGLEVGLFVVGALMMGKLGAEEAAAHQIVLVCAATTFMIPLGISFAGSTRVGQAVGRRDFAAVRPAGLACILVGCLFMLMTAVLFITLPGPVVELFWDPSVERSETVKTFAMELLLIAGFFQIMDGLQVTAVGSLRGLKDVRIPLYICIFSYWVVGLSSAVYLTFYTPLRHQGLWIGLLLGLSTAGLTLGARFWKLSTRVRTDQELQRAVTVESVED